MCNQSPDAEHMCRGAEARGRRAGGGGTFDLLGWAWGAKPQWPEFEQVFIRLFLLAQSWVAVLQNSPTLYIEGPSPESAAWS